MLCASELQSSLAIACACHSLITCLNDAMSKSVTKKLDKDIEMIQSLMNHCRHLTISLPKFESLTRQWRGRVKGFQRILNHRSDLEKLAAVDKTVKLPDFGRVTILVNFLQDFDRLLSICESKSSMIFEAYRSYLLIEKRLMVTDYADEDVQNLVSSFKAVCETKY